VHALPFAIALIAAAVLAPATVRGLSAAGHTRPNYRGRRLPFPLGVLIVAAALVALIPLALLQHLGSNADVLAPAQQPVALYVLGVALLGLIDDELNNQARGVRGHAAALRDGRLSTGTLKAVGTIALALLALNGDGSSKIHYLLAAAVLVLATHVFNLIDLRPGRCVKAFVLLGAGLTLGTMSAEPLWPLGVFVAPVLVAGLYDVRERGMLGDTGSGLVGGLAGLWLIESLSSTGQAVALALLVIIALYGEIRSISALVDRTPGLRALDSWGRP
jgi:UDP-N-acetylmuramyl pentapeptide phosphotransferase/UDP-N-acetylglucosamine-1-phosphate transferase